jgi:hypothetical protein
MRNVEKHLALNPTQLDAHRHFGQKSLQKSAPEASALSGCHRLLPGGFVCVHAHPEGAFHLDVEGEAEAPEVVARGGEGEDSRRGLAQPHPAQLQVGQVGQDVDQFDLLEDLVSGGVEEECLHLGRRRGGGGGVGEGICKYKIQKLIAVKRNN